MLFLFSSISLVSQLMACTLNFMFMRFAASRAKSMSKPTILLSLFLKPIGGNVSSTPMTKVLLSFFVVFLADVLFDELLPHPATTTIAKQAVSNTATSFFFIYLAPLQAAFNWQTPHIL